VISASQLLTAKVAKKGREVREEVRQLKAASAENKSGEHSQWSANVRR
jgi:hypothetical protein